MTLGFQMRLPRKAVVSQLQGHDFLEPRHRAFAVPDRRIIGVQEPGIVAGIGVTEQQRLVTRFPRFEREV